MATILPPATVKPMTESGWSPSATTTPAAPFTRAGTDERCGQGERDRPGRDLGRAPHQGGGSRTGEPAVGPEHDVGIEHGDERLEVATPRGGEERVDHLPLTGPVGVGHGGALHPATGPAGELARRLGGAAHDLGDLVEGHGEHVVQDEGQPLARRQRLEHDQQGETDGVGEERLVLGTGGSSRLTTGSGTSAPSGSSGRRPASAAG